MRRRWFGLVLLPLVSFAADGVVAIVCGSPHLGIYPTDPNPA